MIISTSTTPRSFRYWCPQQPLIVCLPSGTTGGDSRLNKILFKFYCLLIWTYKKTTTNKTFTSWILSLCPCYLMHYYNKRCHYEKTGRSPAPKTPANVSGSVPQKQPAPPLIFNHKAKKSSGDELKSWPSITSNKWAVDFICSYLQVQIAQSKTGIEFFTIFSFKSPCIEFTFEGQILMYYQLCVDYRIILTSILIS